MSVVAVSLRRLLFGNRATPRTLAGARVGLGALAAERQVAPMAQAAIAADFHQALDVERDLLAEVALDAAHFLDDPADVPDVVLGQVLDTDVGTDAGGRQNVVRALPPDAVNIGQSDFDALGARQIYTCDTCHTLPIPDAACAWRWCR